MDTMKPSSQEKFAAVRETKRGCAQPVKEAGEEDCPKSVKIDAPRHVMKTLDSLQTEAEDCDVALIARDADKRRSLSEETSKKPDHPLKDTNDTPRDSLREAHEPEKSVTEASEPCKNIKNKPQIDDNNNVIGNISPDLKDSAVGKSHKKEVELCDECQEQMVHDKKLAIDENNNAVKEGEETKTVKPTVDANNNAVKEGKETKSLKPIVDANNNAVKGQKCKTGKSSKIDEEKVGKHSKNDKSESTDVTPTSPESSESASNVDETPKIPTEAHCDADGVCDVCKHGVAEQRVTSRSAALPYQCQLCPARFRRPCCCTRHFWLHTSIKPFKCEQCDATFTRSYALNIHQRRHNGDKPYSCNVCPRSFISARRLNKHMTAHIKSFIV